MVSFNDAPLTTAGRGRVAPLTTFVPYFRILAMLNLGKAPGRDGRSIGDLMRARLFNVYCL